MEFYILASGSKANSCVVKCDETIIMIDCGGTKKYLTNALSTLDINIEDINALLITHEHSDHIAQLKMFKDTCKIAIGKLDCDNLEVVEKNKNIEIDNVAITPITTSHDATFSCGFIINFNNESLVYMTDTGYVSNTNKEKIKNADYYIFESNHDVEMLMKTNRPMYVKQRILSDIGHLSNDDSSDVLIDVVGDKTKEIVLAHLSEEANDADLAKNTLINKLEEKSINNIKIGVAKQKDIYYGGE